MKLWLVGFFRDIECNDGGIWELVGVYDNEQKAVDACLDWRHFVGPVELNYTCPQEKTDWPGFYYPNKVIVEIEEVEN